MEIINIIETISSYLGLDFVSLLAMAASITVVVNFLKATVPFSGFIKNSYIPYTVAILSLIVSAFTHWGNWLSLLSSTVIMTVLSIGGWATAKTLMHKVGTLPTNSSGGK